MTSIGETSTLQTDKLCYNAISINVLVLVILGDPWAVSRDGRKGGTIVFKHELRNFVVPFLPTRLTAPGSPRMCVAYVQNCKTAQSLVCYPKRQVSFRFNYKNSVSKIKNYFFFQILAGRYMAATFLVFKEKQVSLLWLGSWNSSLLGLQCNAKVCESCKGVAWGFEGVRTKRKVGPPKVLRTGESEGILPHKSFQICHFLRFP